jgi:carboxypeptidase D
MWISSVSKTLAWNVQATFIVQNVHLHLLPSMNPDGFERKSRNNANDVDLNRDFPDQVGFLD